MPQPLRQATHAAQESEPEAAGFRCDRRPSLQYPVYRIAEYDSEQLRGYPVRREQIVARHILDVEELVLCRYL